MRLFSESLNPGNIAACRDLWGDRQLLRQAEFDNVLHTAALLLGQERARGALIRDEQRRPRYFGLTTFVDAGTASDLMTGQRSRLGATLLACSGVPSILTQDGIALANARNGACLVVVAQGWDVTQIDGNPWPQLMGAILREFEEVHAGFHLSAILGEAFGEDGVSIVTRSGAYPHTSQVLQKRCGCALPSIVFWLTREEAVRSWSTLLPMFAYEQPRALFSRQQQRLLREGLSGATDSELAARLAMSVPTVKAVWQRIFERSTMMLPGLIPPESDLMSGTRGAQKRHIVLDYVRKHPSEITPYDRSQRRAQIEATNGHTGRKSGAPKRGRDIAAQRAWLA